VSWLIFVVCLNASCVERRSEKAEEPTKKAPLAIHSFIKKLVFIPPASKPEYPEREALTAMFRSGAESYLKEAGCAYEEISLAPLPESERKSKVIESIEGAPTLVFTYADDFADLMAELSTEKNHKNTFFVVAMPSEKTMHRLSGFSGVYVVKFKMQELGFLGGVIAGQKTLTGNIAVFALDAERDSDFFVAGFSQGLRLERSGSVIHDLRVRRADLPGQDIGKRLSALFSEASQKHDPRFGIDVVVSFLGGASEDFFRGLALSDVAVISSFKIDDSKGPDAFMTSLILDFSLLPKFLLEKFSEEGMLAGAKDFASQRGNRREIRPDKPMHAEAETPRGPQVIEVGIKEGLISFASFENYQRFHQVPIDLISSLKYYMNAISKGELVVRESSPME